MTNMNCTAKASGHYEFNGRWVVARTAQGWRWHDALDLSSGGEWRRTKAEAAADLAAFLAERPHDVREGWTAAGGAR
jgi:hypothetical protein